MFCARGPPSHSLRRTLQKKALLRSSLGVHRVHPVSLTFPFGLIPLEIRSGPRGPSGQEALAELASFAPLGVDPGKLREALSQHAELKRAADDLGRCD